MGRLYGLKASETTGMKTELLDKLKQLADTADFDTFLVAGVRTGAQQKSLYAQGRTASGSIVTNAREGQSPHNYGVAFDIAPYDAKKKKIDWVTDAKFKKLADIGQELGLVAGYYWKTFTDVPHFELAGWRKEISTTPRSLVDILTADRAKPTAPCVSFIDTDITTTYGRDAFGSPIEHEFDYKQVEADKLRFNVSPAALQPGAFRIGDIWLSVPPQSVTISAYQANQEINAIRSPGNPTRLGDLHDIRIDLQLVFPNAATINEELRPILAQFVTSPIISIENYFIQKAITPTIAPAEGTVKWQASAKLDTLSADAARAYTDAFQANQKANATLFKDGKYKELYASTANDTQLRVDVERLIREKEGSKTVEFTKYGWSDDDQPILCTFDDVSIQTTPGFPSSLSVGISLRLFNHKPFTKRVAWLVDWTDAEAQIEYFNTLQDTLNAGGDPLDNLPNRLNYVYTPELSNVYKDYYRTLLPEWDGSLKRNIIDKQQKEFGLFGPYTNVESRPDGLVLRWLNPLGTPAQMMKQRVAARKQELAALGALDGALARMTVKNGIVSSISQIFENINLLPSAINDTFNRLMSSSVLTQTINLTKLKITDDTVRDELVRLEAINDPVGARLAGNVEKDHVRLSSIFMLRAFPGWADFWSQNRASLRAEIRHAVSRFGIADSKLTSLVEAYKSMLDIEEQLVGYIASDIHSIDLLEYDAVITGISAANHNKFVRVPLASEILPTYQHMGRSNTAITITLNTTSLDLLSELRKMMVEPALLEQLRNLYNNGAVQAFLETNAIAVSGNRIFDLLGVKNMLVGNMTIGTVPGSPGLYNVSFDAIQADYALYQYERLSGYNSLPASDINGIYAGLTADASKSIAWFSQLTNPALYSTSEILAALNKWKEINITVDEQNRVKNTISMPYLPGADWANSIVSFITGQSVKAAESAGIKILAAIRLWQAIRNTLVNPAVRDTLMQELKIDPNVRAVLPDYKQAVNTGTAGPIVANPPTESTRAPEFDDIKPYIKHLCEIVPELDKYLRGRSNSAMKDIIQVELGVDSKLFTPGDLYFYRDMYVDKELIDTTRSIMEVEHSATVSAYFDMMCMDIDKYSAALVKDWSIAYPDADISKLDKTTQATIKQLKKNNTVLTSALGSTPIYPSDKEPQKGLMQDLAKLKDNTHLHVLWRSIDRLENKVIQPMYFLRQVRKLTAAVKIQAMCERYLLNAVAIETASINKQASSAADNKELERLLYEINQQSDAFNTAWFQLEAYDKSDDILFDPVLGSLPRNVGIIENDILARVGLQSAYDKTFHMSRAFPAFKLYLIEKDSPQWLLFDDFYSYDAVISIDVLQSADMATKTAVIRLSNVTNVLSDDKVINKENPLEGPNTSASGRQPSRVNIQPGVQIALKLGYDADPAKLTTRFIGTVVEVQPGPEMEIVAQSAGAQLLQNLYPQGASVGFNSTQKSVGSVAGKILSDCPGLKGFGRWGAMEAMNPDTYDPRQSAGDYWKDVAQDFARMPFKLGLKDPAQDNIYMEYAMSPYAWANTALAATLVAGMLIPGIGPAAWYALARNGHLTFDWILSKNKTAWELLQEFTLYNKDYILTTKLYNADIDPTNVDREMRETIYLGPRRGVYKASDAAPADSLQQKKLGAEVRKWIENSVPLAFGAIQSMVDVLYHQPPAAPGVGVGYLDFSKLTGIANSKIVQDVLEVLDPYQARAIIKGEIWEIQQEDNRKLFGTTVLLSDSILRGNEVKAPDVYTQLKSAQAAITEAVFNKHNLSIVAPNLYIPEEQLALKQLFDRTGIYQPVTKYHFVDSYHHIVANNIVASAAQMYNRVRLMYPNREPVSEEEVTGGKIGVSLPGIKQLIGLCGFNTQINEAVVSADDDIYDDAIREIVVPFGNIDTNLWEEPWLAPFHNWSKDEMKDKVKLGQYGKAYQVATNALCRMMEPMYQGELVLIGNPSIEPFDEVYLADFATDMVGPLIVGQVVDHVDATSGYTTTVTPKLYVRPADPFNSINVDYAQKASILATASGGLGGALAALAGLSVVGLVGQAGALAQSAVGGGTTTIATGVATATTIATSAAAAIAVIAVGTVAGSAYVTSMNKSMGTLLGREAVDCVPLWYRGRPLLAGMDGAQKNDWGAHFVEKKIGALMNFIDQNKVNMGK